MWPYTCTVSAALGLLKKALFVFGTLLDADVRSVVLAEEIHKRALVSAVAIGYQTFKLPDETYPILSPSPENQVEGGILTGLSRTQWDRLNFFEGDEYTLADIQVFAKGEPMDACYYGERSVVPGASSVWRLDWWQKHHKHDFLSLIIRYMALFENGDLEQAEALWQSMQESSE